MRFESRVRRKQTNRSESVFKGKEPSPVALSVLSNFVMQILGSAFPLPAWKVADFFTSGLSIKNEW